MTNYTTDSTLDSIDRAILEAVQESGRISNSELAGRVGLSESPCLRRLRHLERSGHISGYHAHLAPDLADRGFTVYVGVRVRRHASEEVVPFEDWTRTRSEIASCYLVSGEYDYLLHVAVSGLAAYESFLTTQLLRNEMIADIRSMIAVRTVKPPFGLLATPRNGKP